MAIDGNNHEVKERHIQLVKKKGKVKALDEELYSEWITPFIGEAGEARAIENILFQQLQD